MSKIDYSRPRQKLPSKHIKTVRQWCVGKSNIVMMSRGFDIAAWIVGHKQDVHLDDRISLLDLLVSTGEDNGYAVSFICHIMQQYINGHGRIRKIFTCGKDNTTCPIEHAQELVDMFKHFKCIIAPKDSP